MPPVTLTLQPIVDELGLTVAAADQAYGILGGLAVTLTPLTVDPLALLFRFRIQVADEQLAAVRQVFQGLAGEKIEVLLATDEAQLAFVDLTGQTPAAIRTAVEEFAQALIALHVAAPGECVRCGTTDSVSAFYHQGQTSLVCPTCLQEAMADWQQRQSAMDRGSLSALVGLPAVFVYAAAGWAAFWSLIDGLLFWFNVMVIDVNNFTIMLGLVVAGAVGACLGTPLGTALRRSGAIRRAPEVLSGLVVCGAAAGGELLYVAVLLFLNFGVFDLRAAVQVLPMLLARYDEFWIVTKLAVAFSIGLFCVMSARTRPQARIEL